MVDQQTDPSGNTEQFRAFVQSAETGSTRNRAVVIALVVAALILVGVGLALLT